MSHSILGNVLKTSGLCALISVSCLSEAATVPVTFTQLTGTTGGTPASTGIWRADITETGIGLLGSITINDASGGSGGSPGQFSGFDLDAVRLSSDLCTDAACAQAATSLVGLGSTFFTPGTQRPAADTKLFGTGPLGNTVDNSVATLGAFDGNSTTATSGAPPLADGFLSMGDNGILSINLAEILEVSGAMYLYIGEVGDNGEVAAASIELNTSPVPVPAAAWLFGSGLLGLAAMKRKRS